MTNSPQKFLFEKNLISVSENSRAIWLTRILNYVGLGATFLAIIVIVFVIQDPARTYGTLTLNVVSACMYCFSLALLKTKKLTLAKLLVSTTGVVNILSYCLHSGIHSMAHLYLFIPFTAAMVIYTQREKLWRNLTMICYLTAFLFLEITFKMGLSEPEFKVPSQTINAFLVAFNSSLTMLAILLIIQAYERDYRRFAKMVDEEKNRAAQILLNILPEEIVHRLKRGNELIAERHENVSVLFADLNNFTKFSTYISPEKLVTFLNQLFSEFDRISEKHNVEKIKTIGDCYMLAAGLPTANKDHAQLAAVVALEMMAASAKWAKEKELPLNLRIGIHSGPVVAGVIGTNKFAYDLWGSTVNTASRMESASMPGQCTISEATYNLLKDDFDCEANETMLIKSLGKTMTYRLVGKKNILSDAG